MTEVNDRQLGHRLSIRPQEGVDYPALTMQDLDIRLDGHRLWTQGGMTLELSPDGVNTLRVGLAVSDLERDAGTALALSAFVKERDAVTPE
jgi:hypothetical protein